MPASFITVRRGEFPSLNKPAAKNDANSMIFSSECKCLGANRQILKLKRSSVFCVWPIKNLSSKSSLDKYMLEEFPSVRWSAMELVPYVHSVLCS
ncbi:hypothetical protein TNIN_464441 [Trichonephila inaurata madagascariensis]|uniref:Uncharacterized protein n=1 Tax=Trichonephila inaurata madagascariensis TaxID=2747483 RepID=A0A8X7BZR2_9ARAC|nr:hypothetical protein TNIN_464441 [Trichonephila inaurata madagascariensis]